MIVRCHPTGKDAAGLTRYLFGPGKANEHSDPRMVAGSPELLGEWGHESLSMRDATHLGRVVEAAWRRQYAPQLALAGRSQNGVIAQEDLVGGPGAVSGQQHVFHASLSMPAGAAELSDEQWQEVATKYVQGMGFVDAEDGAGDCSWFAVNHGRSVPKRDGGAATEVGALAPVGNDHIHVVVCLTRRDGSTASVHHCGVRSQTVRRTVLEKLDYVAALHDQAGQREGVRGFTAAEHNMARDRAKHGAGAPVPDRVLLQRLVRAAASNARTEAEFINNVIMNPRTEIRATLSSVAERRTAGYAVRFKGGSWFAASSLAKDLTLQQQRGGWEPSETETTRAYAAALWRDEVSGESRVTTDDGVADASLEQARIGLGQVTDELVGLPADSDQWPTTERLAAAVVATAATVPDRRFAVDAGIAADALARLSLSGGRRERPPQVPGGLSRMEIAARHIQLAVRATSTHQIAGWVAVLQQLARTSQAIADARRARGEATAAVALERDAVAVLTRLADEVSDTALSQAARTALHATRNLGTRVVRGGGVRGEQSDPATSTLGSTPGRRQPPPDHARKG